MRESLATSRHRWSARDVLAAGQAKCTYGTGAFLLAHTGDRVVPSTRGLITTLAATLGDGPPQYALEGSVFVAGAAVQWFRDGLKAVGAAPEIDVMATKADPQSDVLFVPALTGLGAPHWEPDARGTIFGLTRATTVADLARATLEGVAFQVADLIDAINADLPGARYLRSASTAAWPAPTRSSSSRPMSCDLPLRRSPQVESTALGAALLAGLGVGLLSDPASAAALLEAGGPRSNRAATAPGASRHLARWRKAVATVRGHYRALTSYTAILSPKTRLARSGRWAMSLASGVDGAFAKRSESTRM